MAIYPYTNTYVINKDAVAGSPFKAGMILMMNADGKAVPADSQLLVFNSLGQKQAKILGLAAGDSNLTGNTIIVPDTVGNNYLDENKNFVNASNAEYVAIKRQLLDYADETINEYYNMNFSPIPKRRGIGVYCLTGDTFATDQFNAALHGDYGFDGLDTITFSPGDLLTFGGGVNAGKLVKVNTNSLGPDVVVVGIVEKYNSNIGLLYFRYILDNVSFGNYTSIFYDAANIVSYPGSGATWSNLASTSYNMSLANGPTYSNTNNGVMVFDGTDDSGTSSGFSFTNFTMEMFVNVYQLTGALAFNRIVQTNSTYLTVIGQSFYGPLNTLSLFDSATGYNNTSYIVPLGQYIHLTLVRNGATHEIFVNGVSVYSASLGNATMTNILLADGGGNERTRSTFGYFKIYNKALAATEVLSQYNFHKSRYGL